MHFLKLPVWLKPSVAMAVNAAIVLSILQPVLVFPLTAQAVTTDTLFGDSFGSSPSNIVTGWLDSDTSASDAAIKTSPNNRVGSPTTGYVQLKKKTSYIATTSVSTLGHNNIHLKFYWRGDGDAESSDKLVVEWKPNASSTYATSSTFSLDDESWGAEDLTLPTAASNSHIDIRFRLQATANDEAALIDDVSISGDTLEVLPPPPTPTTGAIHGWKYKDVNGNGIIDGVEPKLEGWTIKLFQGNTLINTQVTAWDGIYNFENVAPGLYKVCEEVPNGGNGWLQTQPGAGTACDNGTNGYSVNVAAGQDIYSIDFGNAPGAIIVGKKYKDIDANGQNDPSDPGIPNWTINLYQNNQLIKTTHTEDNGQGTYVFSGLPAGTYMVCEDLPVNEQNWQQTDPTEAGGSSWRATGRVLCPNDTWGYQTTVTTGEEAYSFDFGNVNGALLAGWKYEDKNNNGQRDEGEPGVPGWTINLYQDDQLVNSTQTEDNGKGTYFFLGLPAGTYKICEAAGNANEWYQTDPTEDHGSTWRSGSRVFCENEKTWGFIAEARRGHEEYSFDFGNNKYGAVRVEKIANPNQGHFEFKLTGPNEYDQTLSTEGSTGEGSPLEFLKLLPGAYALTEILPEGWTGTSTAECLAESAPVEPGSITLTSGLQVRCVFNNSEYGVVTGRKFADNNGSGASDLGEPGLAGWLITLFKQQEVPAVPATEESPEVATSTTWGQIGTATTDDDGAYTFGNLLPGVYRLCEENRAGWIESLPGAGVPCDNGTNGYEFTVSPGSHIETRDFGNHFGEVVPADTEAPHTIITAPGPNSEWEGNILITGTTTDNVGVASTTLSFAPYLEANDDNDNVGTCGDYTLMTVLNNPPHSAVFDWSYSWTPPSDGSYCIKANGTDTSGNEEHTAIVFPVKFKKATPPPSTPPPSNDDDEVSFGGGGGGGGSTSGVGPSSLAFGSTSTPGTGDIGGNNGGDNDLNGLIKKLAVVVPTAGLGGTTTLPNLALGGGGTTTGTSTATSSVVSGSSLLAALGGLGGSWWWLIILIILAGLGGYWYWKKQEDN